MSEIVGALKGLSPEKALLAASMSSGSVSTALETDGERFYNLRERFISVFLEWGRQRIVDILELSADVATEKSVSILAFQIAFSVVRDLLILNIGLGGQQVVNQDRLEKLETAAEKIDRQDLVEIFDEMSKACTLIESEINVNRNLVIDAMFLNILRLSRNSNTLIRSNASRK